MHTHTLYDCMSLYIVCMTVCLYIVCLYSLYIVYIVYIVCTDVHTHTHTKCCEQENRFSAAVE